MHSLEHRVIMTLNYLNVDTLLATPIAAQPLNHARAVHIHRRAVVDTKSPKFPYSVHVARRSPPAQQTLPQHRIHASDELAMHSLYRSPSI